MIPKAIILHIKAFAFFFLMLDAFFAFSMTWAPFLKTSNKKDRPSQTVVSVLESYPAPIPETWEMVTYNTGH